jgi:transcription antitermination factor NusG
MHSCHGGSEKTEARCEPWLVLRTKSRHENTVASSLKQKCIHAYLPKHNVVRRQRDRRIVLEMPLFPGYVFVRPSLDQYANIRYIPGSCGFVVAAGKPAAMPERDVEAVKILVSSGAALAVNPQLIPGRPVQVIAGPFMGIKGELIRVKNQERLVINAHLLSSSVSVEVDSDKICVL